MNITIQIPNSWLLLIGLPPYLIDTKSEVISFTKARLGDALVAYAGEAASLPETKGGLEAPFTRMMFSLPSAQASLLSAICRESDLTPGPMAKRLLYRLAADADPATDSHQARIPADHPMVKTNLALGYAARPEQVYFYNNLIDALESPAVGFVEGGTGIGKTRAMVRAALHWIESRQTNSAIAVPTVALLRQFLSEYKTQTDGIDGVPEIQAIMGRREFVSEIGLQDFLMSEGGRDWDTPEVRQWLKNGGLNAEEDSSSAWQVDSLLKCSPLIPAKLIALDDFLLADDKGYQAYRKQFVKVDGEKKSLPPRLLLFTHAMLAQDLRRRMFVASADPLYKELLEVYIETCRAIRGKKAIAAMEDAGLALGIVFADVTEMSGILPDYRGLIIDEAHQFEQILSSSVSEHISLKTLRSQLIQFTKVYKGQIRAGSIDSFNTAVSELSAAAEKMGKKDVIELSKVPDMRLIGHLQVVADICCTISRVRDKSSAKFLLALKILRAGNLIRAAIDPQKKWAHAFLRPSPVRAFPQIIVTNSNSISLINRLWNSVSSCALVSATLYLKTSGSLSENFVRSVLSVPHSLAKTYTPVHAPWSISTVDKLYVEPAGSMLQPPSSKNLDDKDKDLLIRAMNTWHHALAQKIIANSSSAVGGTLILCTSFQTVNALYQQMLSAGIPKEKLVYDNGEDSLMEQRKKFMTARKNGLRAIWLAVGGAWTGLDVGGHTPWRELFGEELPAAEDNVLTDLVIPRLPFRTNQSISHLLRLRKNPGYPWDYLDAALRFTQGLGRLVRREGLPKNRRIFILDSRLSEPERARQLVPFVEAIKPYRRG